VEHPIAWGPRAGFRTVAEAHAVAELPASGWPRPGTHPVHEGMVFVPELPARLVATPTTPSTTSSSAPAAGQFGTKTIASSDPG